MGDRKRRWVCRAIFLACCALPFFWILSLIPTQPTAESLSKDLSHLFGLPVEVAEVETPDPYKTILKNVKIQDPEVGTVLLLDRLELRASRLFSFSTKATGEIPEESQIAKTLDYWDSWRIQTLEVTEGGLPFLSDRFHETLLRLRRRTGFPIEVEQLKVVRKTYSDGWEQEVAKSFQLPGKTVLRLKELKFNSVSSSQIAKASVASHQHSVMDEQVIAEAHENIEDVKTLPWRSGWQLSGKIADPNLLNSTQQEATFPIEIEIHRVAGLGIDKKTSQLQFATYWTAALGVPKEGGQVPWSWVAISKLGKIFSLPTYGANSPRFSGSLSGLIAGNHWTLSLENFFANQLELSDIDRMVCGDGPQRINGQCYVLVKNAKIKDGKILFSNFGIRGQRGAIDRQMALQMSAHRSVDLFGVNSGTGIINFKNLSIRFFQSMGSIRIEGWDRQENQNGIAVIGAQDEPVIHFKPGSTFQLSNLVRNLSRSSTNVSAPNHSSYVVLANFLTDSPRRSSDFMGTPTNGGVKVAHHTEPVTAKRGSQPTRSTQNNGQNSSLAPKTHLKKNGSQGIQNPKSHGVGQLQPVNSRTIQNRFTPNIDQKKNPLRN